MVHPQLPMETEKKKRILILSFSNKTLERLFLEQNRLDGSHSCRWQPGKNEYTNFGFFEHNFRTIIFRTKSLKSHLRDGIADIP